MTPDVIALRAHLVAEVEQARQTSIDAQCEALRCERTVESDRGGRGPLWSIRRVRQAGRARVGADRATDAWLAADARLRALDGLIEASGVAVRP